MILYIVRHAWAAEPDESAWPDDADRPLTDDGSKRFASVVRKLADRGFRPQHVATSPLLRCRQTAQIIADGVKGHPPIVPLDALGPESNLEALLAWTNGEAGRAEEVAWVGHAPDVGLLTAALVGEGMAAIHFSKGAVAAIEFEGRARAAAGELRWLLTAKMLGL
jgi:phosphohistidine phosphatase